MTTHLLPATCQTLAEAAQAVEAPEDADRPGYFYCDSATQARQLVGCLGAELPIPAARENHTYIIYSKHGELKAETPAADGDTLSRRWQRKNKTLKISLGVPADQRSPQDRTTKYDSRVRSTSRAGDGGIRVDGGLYLTDADGNWHQRTTEKARLQLYAEFGSDKPVQQVLGDCIHAPWELVNIPFGPEYPAKRQWNLGAPQLKYQPQPGDHPHWDMIFDHIGGELSTALVDHPWAARSGIKTGRQYLMAWAAWMFQHPFQPLPYLFMYGEQNSGKSIFHETLAELMTKGVASADRALTNANDFNGELANAVLAYVEEKDIRLSPGAYNKLKDWVTSRILWIRKMRTDAYPQANTLHFVHTANSVACPIVFGDTRIVMIHVPELAPGAEIPKEELIGLLCAEGPAITHTLLNMPLAEPEGRLGLPVIATASKEEEIDSTVPEFIRAIVDYMADRTSALLTTAALENELGPGKWPADLRHAKQLFELWGKYLASKGIAIDYPARRVAKHWPIQITKHPRTV